MAKPSQALKLVTMAVKHDYRGSGVSVLSTPTDVLAERLGGAVYAPQSRLFRSQPAAGEEEITAAASLINESRKVFLFAGWGARHYGGTLLDVARKPQVPIATASRAKGVVHESDEHSIGVLGSLQSRHAARAVQACDLILIAGSGFRQPNLVPPG